MSNFVNPNEEPETRTVREGRVNITRKGSPPTARKANAPGVVVDDGSIFVESALDEHDPNFDSEEDEGCDWVQPSHVASETKTLGQYKASLGPLIAEYFSSGDVYDFLDNVTMLKSPAYLFECVKKSISLSFDRNDRERELVSQFLSIAYPDLLSSSTLGKGFERLFEQIDELVKDTPMAKQFLTKYLARAVVDEVLPPSYLMDPVVCNLGGEVVVNARVMLSQEHTGTKFDHIWGPGDGHRSVTELKVSIDLLCEEYMLSLQLAEATHCVKEMNIPQYHHEVVKRAIKTSLDKKEESQKSISALLTYLVKSAELMSVVQLEKGFKRVVESVGDWVLDTPNARAFVNGFISRAVADGILPTTFLECTPTPTPTTTTSSTA